MSRVRRWGRRMDAWVKAHRRGQHWDVSFERLPTAHNDSHYRREGIPRLGDQAFERANPSPVGDPLALLREAEERVVRR